ncbi:hypothetical protein [Rhizobium sp. P44RR-XXIV]|uniref:hypothetical protein n=1 Tax=Rhizobium sp. P44RR-XXIV TaxID=1921145 RepID=UPI0009877644|nr:hypothetical protein [Rhizobium sp. P44RR-XXIV]TIX91452.1 hypothetical protein BSK43_010905 [Rhizobium sp. P44RR-XXIV]
MAIDLVCHQFRSHSGCIGEVRILAFNQRTGTRDTKVMPMGSDKDGLEVDSKSWTGTGSAESGFGKTENSEFSWREALSFDRVLKFMFFLTASQILITAILHVAYHLFDGTLSPNIDSVVSELFFSGSHFSYDLKIKLEFCGAIILIKAIALLIRRTTRLLQRF